MNLEEAVRGHLRGDGALMALVNGDEARVNMDWTGAESASRVVVARTGGARDDYLPLDNPVVAAHCYGSTRPAAAKLADAVAEALWRVTSADKPLQSASVESTVYLPTPSGVSRYVVTAVVTATAPAYQA